MYCTNCGKQMSDDARFCGFCGTESVRNMTTISNININKNNKNIQHEVMIKCPNCGSSISRLNATCSFCGAQIVGKKASKSVTKFAEELMQIEECAPENDFSDLKNPLLSFYPKEIGRAVDKAYGTKTFEKKLSLIKSFPIPNSVEEIAEFILLAIANINVDYGKKSISNSILGKPGAIHYTEVTLATTWINKMEQAYNKAEIAFPDDPVFVKIKCIYENKMKELKRV